MVAEIRLPPLGLTSDEMSIVEWYKSEGDAIQIAEPLLCVETDKAQVDVESAEEGIVLKIIAQPGGVLSSGALLAYVGEAGEEVPSGEYSSGPDAPLLEEAPPNPESTPAQHPKPDTVRARMSPVVRKLAVDLGVDLTVIMGSGPGGLIVRADVQRAHEEQQTGGAKSAIAEATPEFSDVPALRRVIARRLTKSVQTVPQFSIVAHLDARVAKQQIAGYCTVGKPGLTYTHLLLRAVARALREHPTMRRLWSDEGPKYRTLASPDVGLAVAGDGLLYVVTIPAPDSATLPALVETVAAAVGRGRAGTLSKDDQAPAAITVSNLGMFGVDSFEAIVDPDQTAILAAASVQDRVVAENGVPAVVPQLTVSLSCDHRTVDGAQAARFLQTLRTYFETDSVSARG